MRKWTMLLPRIKRLKIQKNGSIALEAALIFPILILLFYLFYMFLLACLIQMSMKSVAVTTVNSISSQIHVVDKLGQVVKLKTGFTGQMNSSSTISIDDEGWLDQQLLSLMPEPIYSIIDQGKRGNWWPATNLAATLIGKNIFENMLIQLPESRGFEKERLSLVYLQLPDIVNYTDATVSITLQYELPYSIPFLNKSFVLREQASQRAWLPDTRSNNFTLTEDDMFIQFVSITPNPVRPGNKAAITVKTKPNAQISIEITYKSGTSVAKNLESKTANDRGEITWEWFVSGNTTPGLWQYHFTEVGGEAELKGVFEVKKKEKH